MNFPRGQSLVLGSWGAVIVLATLRQILSGAPGLPSPSVYLGSSVLFSGFLVGAAFAPELFGVLSVGVVVALVFKPYINAKTGDAIPQSGPIFQVSQFLDSISGSQKGGS